MPPSEPHDEFLKLCAVATTGSLNAEERKRLEQHLSHCVACREAMAQYEALVSKTIPAMAPGFSAEDLTGDASHWSLEDAEASLFARLGGDETESKHFKNKGTQEPWKSDSDRQTYSSPGDILWRHVWWQYAAGLLLIIALGFSLYRIGIRRGAESAWQTTSVTLSTQTQVAPQPSNPNIHPSSVVAEQAPSDTTVAQLRAEIEKQSMEVTRLKSLETQMQNALSEKQAATDHLTQEKADLARQLDAAQASLQSIQQKLNLTAGQGSQDAARVSTLEAKLNELTDSLHERDQEVAREQELLDHDRDIRELMGARDLYIAEVYDVAKTGDTQKPFGRVFYTKGKSLIFYAYDLDEQPGIKSASTFQAWGRRGPDQQQAVSLGILYEDNANKKRWVVKSDDPKTLAHIDGVFVTVEPQGGSSHPSGKPLLFAYLRIEPNHP